MLSQKWIINKGKTLASVTYRPYNAHAKAGVVLLPGFGQPMCDDSYFMSKLAHRLADLGFYVLQAEPRGHGDSSGNLEDVTIGTYCDDIKAIISDLTSNYKGSLYCVGRGLSATLCASVASHFSINGIVGINPYLVEESVAKKVWNYFNDDIFKAETFEVTDVFPTGDGDGWAKDKLAFIEAIGADVENLIGQKLSSELIQGISNLNLAEIIACSKKVLWLLTDDMKLNSIREWTPNTEEHYLPLDTRKHYSLPYHPMWHHNAIERVCNWIDSDLKL